jgi:ribosome-binding factor A
MSRRPQQDKKPPGQRQLRVAERIRHILADVLRRGDLHDPVLAKSSLITVTAVEIGPDLKHATAFVMPLGGENAAEVAEAMNRAAGYFRTEVGHQLELRHAPKISFRVDHSFERMAHIDGLLRRNEVRRDLEKQDDVADDE